VFNKTSLIFTRQVKLISIVNSLRFGSLAIIPCKFAQIEILSFASPLFRGFAFIGRKLFMILTNYLVRNSIACPMRFKSNIFERLARL